MIEHSTNAEKPRRRWLQFSLRTLLAIVTIFCLGFGWFMQQVASLRDEFRAEQERVAVINQRGGNVSYEDVSPFWGRWFAGSESLTIGMRVTHVRFESHQEHPITDTSTVRTIELLRKFQYLYVVEFSYAHFADDRELGGTNPEEVKRELNVAVSEEAN